MRSNVLSLALLALLAAGPAAGFSAAAYTGRLMVHMPGTATFADLYWRLEGSGASERGYFALSVPSTTGWIGFGVGEVNSGSMPGADIAIATVDGATMAVTIGDYHALGFSTPQRDCRTAASDWAAVGAARNATHTTVEFSRLLLVADADEDRAIERRPNGGAQKFLLAWGASDMLAYHGRTDRAMFQVDLFAVPGAAKPLDALLRDPGVSVLAWHAANISVPAVDTLYADTPCVDGSSVAGLHVVGYNVHVSNEANRQHLHHMLLQGFSSARCRGLPTTLWGVASAHVPFVFPSDISLALDFASYSVQIHYDNPALVAGIVDASGVDVYVTQTPRTNQAGVLTTADPTVGTRTALAPGYTTIDYNCPGGCTQQWAANITVFGELLHMHQTGNLMRSDFVAPDGTSVLATSEAEWYAFHTQQNQLLPRFVVPRGSSIRTRCVFKVNDGAQSVRFGIASSEEMCMHFIYYYPRQSGPLGMFCGYGICGGITASDTLPTSPLRNFNGTCGITSPPPTMEGWAQSSAASIHTLGYGAVYVVLCSLVAAAIIV